MIHKLLAVLIICMVLSAGCAPIRAFLATVTPPATAKPRVDLLADTTCAKPCVLGITPGVTAQSETWAIVQNSKLLSNCMQHDRTSQGGIRWIDCSFDAFNVGSLSISFFSDAGDGIAIRQRPVTVEQLIQRYGDPGAVQVLGALLPDEPPNSTGILAYKTVQAIVTLVQEPTEAYEVTPETRVAVVTFWSSAEYARLSADILRQWKGYGVYAP